MDEWRAADHTHPVDRSSTPEEGSTARLAARGAAWHPLGATLACLTGCGLLGPGSVAGEDSGRLWLALAVLLVAALAVTAWALRRAGLDRHVRRTLLGLALCAAPVWFGFGVWASLFVPVTE